MKKGTAIHWFRQDLRLSDNPALDSAAQYETLIPIYILDEVNSGEFKMGAASKWWLHQSLTKLNESLDGKLLVYQGNPHEILNKLIEEQEVSYVTWNRCYEPWRIDRDKEIKETLKTRM